MKKLRVWWIGFMDGEGNFQTFRKKRLLKSGRVYYNVGYGIHLGLHERDFKLLRYLKKELNIPGKIYHYKEKKKLHLAIVKKEDIKYVLKETLGEYSLIKKEARENYMRLKYGILNEIKRFESKEEYEEYYEDRERWEDRGIEERVKRLKVNEKEYESWLRGFITGEGCFIKRRCGRKEFSVEQVDRELLEMIREKIKNRIIRKEREGRRKSYEIRISKKEDINNLKEILDGGEGLLGYKLSQYEEWKRN